MLRIILQSLVLITIIFFSSIVSATIEPDLTVDDFLQEADLRDVELSPNGRYLAMIWSQDQARILLVKDLETPGTPTVGLLKEEFIRPSSVYWANDERLLVKIITPRNLKAVIKLSKKEEDFDVRKYRSYMRLMSLDINLKDPIVLMESKRSVSSVVSNFLSNDQDHIIMPKYEGRRNLYKVNVYTGETSLITKTGKRTYKIFTNVDGKPLYRLDYYWIAKEIEIFEYTDKNDWKQIDSIYFDKKDEESVERDGLIRFGVTKDSNLVYRQRNKKTGFYEIITRKRNSKETKVLVSLENQDVEGAITNTRSSTIIGYFVEKDLIRNHYFDEGNQDEYDVLSKFFKNENFTHYSYSKNTKKSIIKSTGQDNPGAFYIFDKETKKLTFIGSQFKKLSPNKIGMPAMVNIKTRNGDKIRSYVLFPPNYNSKLKYPMVIMPHGGPQYRDNAGYDGFAQFIATRGYIVVKPNFHGSTGYGFDFEKTGYKQWGGLMQDDLTDTVKYMIKNNYANPDKVCIVGGSYGGYAALMGAVKTPDLYKCAISINGVTHLIKQTKYDIKSTPKEYRKKIRKLQYERVGHNINDSKMLNANSPALHADKIKIPILLIAGEKDETVPIKQAKMMANALDDADKEFEFMRVKDAGHNIFYYYEDAEKTYKKIEKFLSAYLQ